MVPLPNGTFPTDGEARILAEERVMWTDNQDETVIEEGLCVITAQFFTPHLLIQGEVISPDPRLSDHLNSPTSTFEVSPTRVERLKGAAEIELTGTDIYVSKAHLQFVLPSPHAGGAVQKELWLETLTQTCWASIGPYTITGKLHMEASRNPRFFLRSLERRQFLPLTDVRLTFPDGTEREFPAVIVNRFHMEILSLQSGAPST